MSMPAASGAQIRIFLTIEAVPVIGFAVQIRLFTH